jgi:hypothetical protein
MGAGSQDSRGGTKIGHGKRPIEFLPSDLDLHLIKSAQSPISKKIHEVR